MTTLRTLAGALAFFVIGGTATAHAQTPLSLEEAHAIIEATKTRQRRRTSASASQSSTAAAT